MRPATSESAATGRDAAALAQMAMAMVIASERARSQSPTRRLGGDRFDLGERLRHPQCDAHAADTRRNRDVELVDALCRRSTTIDADLSVQGSDDFGPADVVLHLRGIDRRVGQNPPVGSHDGETQVGACDKLLGELRRGRLRIGGYERGCLCDRGEVALLLVQCGLSERRVERPCPRTREDGGDQHVPDDEAGAVGIGVASQIDHRRTPFSPMSAFSTGSKR